MGSETFSCTGKTLLDPGYTVVMHWQALGKNETVPSFIEGQIYEVQDVSKVTSSGKYSAFKVNVRFPNVKPICNAG